MQEATAFMMPEPLLTIADVAAWLNVHERTVKRLIARGELAALKVAGATRVDPDDVRAYLDGQRAGPAPPTRPRQSLRIVDAGSGSYAERVRSQRRSRGGDGA